MSLRRVATAAVACVVGVVGLAWQAPPAAAATTVNASLVQMIDTTKWNPSSPDPSGIVYLPALDRMEIADSEVDETTGAGYHGVNLWQLNPSNGAITDEGTTWKPVGFSDEPTGLGYIASSNTLLISDDTKRYIWLDQPGPDGRFGTTDDTQTHINAGAWGSTDTEDPEYLNGHIFFLDGKGTEVYNIGPGGDGKFGTSDDTMSHFDVGYLGPQDWEGLSSNPANGNLFVGARAADKIFEVTPTGSLVATIDCKGITGLMNLSGLAYAPSSTGSGWDFWIVDRAVDNNQVASENDGKLWEVSAPGYGSVDSPPSVSISSPKSGATVAGTVTVSASASDDHGVKSVQFFLDGSSIGTDSSSSGGWSVSWDTTKVADGSHTLTAKATDTANQTTTSMGVGVTVHNDQPPKVSLTSPSAGSLLRGTVTVSASASDDHGVTSVAFYDGGSKIGTDSSSNGGWSVPWDTSGAADGSHALKAVATDTVGQSTTSATVTVSTDNTAPAVALTSPSAGRVLRGTVTVTAQASDANGITQVRFFDGKKEIGTDTNGADGWSVAWNTTGASQGAHQLRARAWDGAGNSAVVAVKVTVDNVAPDVVAIRRPKAGATVKHIVTVRAKAHDDLRVKRVAFFDGTTLIGVDTDGSDGWSVRWRTGWVNDGAHRLRARAFDRAGNRTTSAAVKVIVAN